MVPDWKVVQDYLEILEFPELKGIVFMQTACQAVQHQRGRRYLFCIIYLFMVQVFFLPIYKRSLVGERGEEFIIFIRKDFLN